MKREPTQVITIRLPASTVEWIDELAHRRRWSRAGVIRLAVEELRLVESELKL